MYCVQQFKKQQMMNILDTIINSPVLEPIDQQQMNQLLKHCKTHKKEKLLINRIREAIRDNEQIIIQLKCISILYFMVLKSNIEETIFQINQILQELQRNLKKGAIHKPHLFETDSYLEANVLTPYVAHLRKMISRSIMNISSDENGYVDIGFSLINNLKDIIQLRKMFHNYGCYYPTHLYAATMFEACALNIKHLWRDICHIAKDITQEALRERSILAEEYLFLQETETLQNDVISFVHQSYFQGKIRKELKPKYFTLLRPEIKTLEKARKKKQVENQTLKTLKQKRQLRKKCPKDQNGDEKLNTQIEIQILESIQFLENLVNNI